MLSLLDSGYTLYQNHSQHHHRYQYQHFRSHTAQAQSYCCHHRSRHCNLRCRRHLRHDPAGHLRGLPVAVARPIRTDSRRDRQSQAGTDRRCGIRRGAVHGATAGKPKLDPDKPQLDIQDVVTVADLHATILSALGLEYDLELDTPIGRPMKRCEGSPITSIMS